MKSTSTRASLSSGALVSLQSTGAHGKEGNEVNANSTVSGALALLQLFGCNITKGKLA